MDGESCPFSSSSDSREVIARLIHAKRIAVVGLSDDTTRAAWMIASFLREAGREVIPVNPKFTTLLGLKCYPSVQAIGERVDLVDVFRRSQFCPETVEDAVAAHAGGIWLQSG